MIIHPEKLIDMQIRDNALESVAICLRLGLPEEAKIHGELSRKMAERIKTHKYGDNAPLPTTKDI